MTDYYDGLAESPNPARRVGWKRRIGQAYRYELAVQLVRAGDRLLDIGCGEGELASYAQARRDDISYTGVEVRRPLEAVRHRVLRTDFRDIEPPECDCAVAIGTLVDSSGAPPDETRSKRRGRDLLDWMRRTDARAGLLVAIDRDRLDAAPWLGDPQLEGIRAEWLEDWGLSELRTFAATRFEIGVYWGGEIDTARAITDAFGGPFGPFDAAEGAWLSVEAGNVEMARDYLARDVQDAALAAIVEARADALDDPP